MNDCILIITTYRDQDKTDYNLNQYGNNNLTPTDLANILNLFKNAYGEEFLEEAFDRFDESIE